MNRMESSMIEFYKNVTVSPMPKQEDMMHLAFASVARFFAACERDRYRKPSRGFARYIRNMKSLKTK